MTWKPLVTRPHHVSGARGDNGAGTAREGTPEPKKVKEHSQLQAKRAYPTAGKELESLVIKHSAIEKIVKIPDEEWEHLKAVQRQ